MVCQIDDQALPPCSKHHHLATPQIWAQPDDVCFRIRKSPDRQSKFMQSNNHDVMIIESTIRLHYRVRKHAYWLHAKFDIDRTKRSPRSTITQTDGPDKF